MSNESERKDLRSTRSDAKTLEDEQRNPKHPLHRAWLDAMHPFGGYTADKQHRYLQAWREAK